jgi:hypothetical protein
VRQLVIEFSKKNGDFGLFSALSQVDSEASVAARPAATETQHNGGSAVSSRRISVIAIIVAAAAGAILGVALLNSPDADADVLPTLPIPPFDPPNGFFLPGTGGDWTNVEDSGFPSYEVQYDQAYTVPDGSYEIQGVQEPYPGLPEDAFSSGSEQVISSDGMAPAVGTEWNYEQYLIPAFGNQYGIFANSSLTTSAGTVDAFEWLPSDSVNDFYSGPAGTFDYLVYDVGTPEQAAIPIIDMPAETSSAAAADFSTLVV